MQGAFLPSVGGAAAALAVLFALSYIQFRHVALALAAVLAPAPGYALAVALRAADPALGYLCGFFLAGTLATQIELRVCDGTTSARAVREMLRSYVPSLLWLPVLAIGVAVVLFGATHAYALLLQAGAIAACCGFALIGIFSSAGIMPFGTEFIARANRLREAWERLLDRLAFLVQPRWGWSVAGIALVFAIIGFFGSENATASKPLAAPLVLPICGGLFAAIAYAATRDVRRTGALCISALALLSLACCLCRRMAVAEVGFLLSVAVMPALAQTIQSAAFARNGDNAAVATLRSTEILAVAIIFFCTGGAVVSFALGPIAGALLIPLGGVAALIVTPALTTVIYDLAPPRMSLDAYRIR